MFRRYCILVLGLMILWGVWRQMEYCRMSIAASKDGFRGESAKNELLLAFPGWKEPEESIALLHLKVAVSKMHVGQYQEAAEHFEAAKKASPQFYGLHQAAADYTHFLFGIGKEDEAAKAYYALYERAAYAKRNPPQSVDAFIQEVPTRLRQRTNWRKNFPHVWKDLRQNIDYGFVIFLLKAKKEEYRNPEQALRIARELANRNTENAFFWEFLAYVEYENSHPDLALKALDRCEEMHPAMKLVADSRWKYMRVAIEKNEVCPIKLRLR